MNIKTGDNVKVLAGKDRGQTGKVVQILNKEERIVVDGVNKMKKNVRPRREGQKGQVVEYNGPIHVSNALLVCPKCNKATRIRISRDKNGEKTRICVKCEANI